MKSEKEKNTTNTKNKMKSIEQKNVFYEEYYIIARNITQNCCVNMTKSSIHIIKL